MSRPIVLRPARASVRERGVVLLFCLIALVVMLIGAVALMRSFNTSLFMSGNIAFKRDLRNQGERVIDLVKTQFTGTALPAASRTANHPELGYSAQMLPVNSQGIPTALSSTNFASTWPGGVYNLVDPTGSPASGVSIVYIIDRLCNAIGDPSTLGAANCVISGAPPSGTSSNNLLNASQGSGGNLGAAQLAVVYRISMRVTGPRNTVAYFQSTVAAP